MSTTKKVILGIFTILPALLLIFYIVMFFSFFFNVAVNKMQHAPEVSSNEIPIFLESLIPMFVMMFVAGITGLALMIYYIIHISKNQKFDSTQRLLWILIIVFTNTIGQIVYFILEVWPQKPAEQSLS